MVDVLAPSAKMNAPGGSRNLHARHFTTPDEGVMHNQSTDCAPVLEETRDFCVMNLLALGDISVDEEGRVWRHGKRVGNTFSPYPEPRRIDHATALGYRVVKLTIRRGKRINASAHGIQWVKHNGPIPAGLEINHKDMDKANNRIENLELVTHSENLLHCAKNHPTWATSNAGEKSYLTKLTVEDVRFIREEVASGRATRTQMARRFGITQPAVSQIVSRKRWKNV